MSFAALAGGVAGAAAGAERVGEAIVTKSDSQIRQDDRDIRQAQEGRAAEQHEWGKAAADVFQTRNLIDQPPQQAPAPDMGPGGQGVIPGAEGQPAPAPAPQQLGSRRDRYNAWNSKAERLMFLTGGMEGLTKFREMENAVSRKQVMGYGLQAVRAMDEGDVGGAMKAANSALESTPFDTGLQFEAHNGQLHMVGADGKPGAALSADHLRAFVEDNMKTPEQYLAWKEQYETERSAKEREKTQAINAESTRRQADQYVKEGAGRDLLRKAQAYAALAGGEAALLRAEGAGKDSALAWTEENMLKIEEMEKTALDGGLGFGGAWMSEGARNTQLNSDAVGAAVETRIANAPNAMTHNDAATISRMAYFSDLKDEDGAMVAPDPTMLKLLGDTRVFTDDNGNYMVDYKGKRLLVPPHVGTRINLNKQQTSE